ncbi:MAG: PAS domain S-box protein [Nitrospirae bacterium]|nr:MAG: PAS domain S-box protein [Nitrospirota bacterium]
MIAEQHFRQFTWDQLPHATFWIDAIAQCHGVNPHGCERLGYSRQELEGMRLDRFCPDYHPEEWSIYWTQLQRDKYHVRETHLRAKDGRLIPVELFCWYIEWEGQAFVCLFAHDISERRHAASTIHRLDQLNQLILQSAGEGIFGLDLEGRHTFVNPAAAAMLGYESSELLGQPSHRVWHHSRADGSPYHEEECPMYQTVQDGQIHMGDDETFWRKNGTSFSAQYVSTPLRDEAGHLIGAVVTFLDITERKRLATQLLEETKLAEVATVLGEIGHDIKNMLMPVLNGTSLLEEELLERFARSSPSLEPAESASQCRALDLLHMITTNARRIHTRVREMADTVKGRASPLQLRACRMAGVIEEVFDTLRMDAHERGVTLHTNQIETLPVLQADEQRLFNAFYNLIANAIPETPAGGSVTVSGRQDDNAVTIAVTDTGRGMPSDVCESLFTTEAISRKRGGTGLGTKIVHDIVIAHGGKITVESQEGQGTTFWLTFPLNKHY